MKNIYVVMSREHLEADEDGWHIETCRAFVSKEQAQEHIFKLDSMEWDNDTEFYIEAVELVNHRKVSDEI